MQFCVRIGLAEVDGLLGLVERHVAKLGDVQPHVPHPAHLGHNRSVHAVVGVAHVAVLVAEELVARVARGERAALQVVGIRGVRNHHVARAAEFALLGRLEPLEVAGRRDTDRKHAEAEEEPHLGDPHEGRSPNEVDDQNDCCKTCANERKKSERRLVQDHRMVFTRRW